MIVVTIPYAELDSHYKAVVDAGFNWGCLCGESHESQESAEACYKCVKYLRGKPFHVYFTPSVDSSTMQIVA